MCDIGIAMCDMQPNSFGLNPTNNISLLYIRSIYYYKSRMSDLADMATFVATVLRDDVIGTLIAEAKECQNEIRNLKNLTERFNDRNFWIQIKFVKARHCDRPIIVYENVIDKKQMEASGEWWFDLRDSIEISDILDSEMIVDGKSYGVVKTFPYRQLLGHVFHGIHDTFGFSTLDDFIHLEITVPEPPKCPVKDFASEGFDLKHLDGLQANHLRGVMIEF